MTDLWGFLLQTLTVSGAAVLLLIVKAMFRDKLSPRWQFAAWGVLGLVLLVPAGLGGRYTLVNWPLLVEAAKSALTGDYSLTRVVAPIPLPRLNMPGSAAEWLYAVYVIGVLVLLLRYLVSYLRLRLALRRGTPAGEERIAQIAAVAERYGLSPCRAVEVSGLPSAFICGVFWPVLALPAGVEVDDKVLLHELLHRRHKDVAWGLVICLFRCIHWCNPLLWYCANRAGNDLEARCDQRVLELLEGEERRDYGHILLSMANDKYARAPGTSSMANGGRNIRARIEAIARLKKYPAGMALVSVCMVILLAAPLLLGTPAQAVYDSGGRLDDATEIPVAMASARLLRCTTPAGALDAYAKAVLDQNGYYRAMCAPLAEQEEIADSMLRASRQNQWPLWDSGLPCWPDTQSGYVIYNLEPAGEDAYEGLLVIRLNYPPDGQPAEDVGAWLGVQQVRTELQEGRWVVLPLEDFRAMGTTDTLSLNRSCRDLPAYHYEAKTENFTIRLDYQTTYTVDSYVQSSTWFSSTSSFDTTPQPHAEFTAGDYQELRAVYTGDLAGKEGITHIGISMAPLNEDGSRPELRVPGMGDSGGNSTDGSNWGARSLEEGWGPEVFLSGGGSYGGDPEYFIMPEAFAADLYINVEKAAELTLLPVEGGPAS
ncbi:MAG: M56 family metallopeptidase [Oscillospiraceae bacterium]